MKKVLSIALALVMMFALCVSSFATVKITNETAEQTANAHIYTTTTSVEASYVVTIPAENPIEWGATSTQIAYTLKSQLDVGKVLHITVKGKDDSDKLISTAGNEIPYTLSNSIESSVDALNYTAPAEVMPLTTRNIYVNIADADWDAVPIDTYEDYLTFTVELVSLVVTP